MQLCKQDDLKLGCFCYACRQWIEFTPAMPMTDNGWKHFEAYCPGCECSYGFKCPEIYAHTSCGLDDGEIGSRTKGLDIQ
jgi:hypothetical protein